MTQSAAEVMKRIALREPIYRDTVDYLYTNMSRFLRAGDRVLLCESEDGEGSMAALLGRAVIRAGAQVTLWERDCRWQTLLRQAFATRASVIIGRPLVVLGLAKLAKATQTPLFIRNVLLVGAPSEQWMVDGIREALDARIWGCYDPLPGLIVAGFSCREDCGVHIRSDALNFFIRDGNGLDVLPGQRGRIYLSPVSDPTAEYDTCTDARLLTDPCGCGCPEARLMDFRRCPPEDDDLGVLCQQLLSWSSVLDYRAERRDSGLFLEVVTFPGQRLPVMPSFAAGGIRNWNPKEDVPFFLKTHG